MSPVSKKSPQEAIDPENWVDDYGDYLFRYALGRLRNHTDAENVVQETFLAALQSKANFAGRSSERTWLIGILKHKIVDSLRRNYREKPVTDLQDNEETIDQFFDRKDHLRKMPSGWLPNPKELLENQEFWVVLHKCQEKLPKTVNDAFTLREIEKMQSGEICEVLNISESNLWVMLYRARLQLRQCLEVNWFENFE